MTSRLAISIDKKNVFPKNDTQQNKVYQLDHEIGAIVFKKFNKKDISSNNFLDIAVDYFGKEGFTEIRCFNNKSKRTSQVNIWTQRLSFSIPVIQRTDMEVVIHELAHAVCRFHYGYSYKDSHNELFVNILFSLLSKYFNISIQEMEKLADEHDVKYFYNINLKSEKKSKKEFEKIKKTILKDSNYLLIQEDESKNKSFKTTSFALNTGKMISLFESNNGIYIYSERNLMQFEKDLHINHFVHSDKKELLNIRLVSPLFKMNIDGRVSSSGKYHSFGTMDIDKANKSDRRHQYFQLKEMANKERRDYIDKHKKGGYQIVTVKSIEQFFALSEHLIKALELKRSI